MTAANAKPVRSHFRLIDRFNSQPVRAVFKIPIGHRDAIRAAAVKTGRSQSSIVADALAEWLDRNGS